MCSAWSISEYKKAIKNLNSIEDVKRVSEETGRDFETLRIIFFQKETRRMIRLHGKIFGKREELLWKWNSGKTIVEIAEDERFSPVLLIHILLAAMEISKKKTKKIVKNPAIVDNERMEKEIREAMEVDYLYSPEAHKEQISRGKKGEDRLFRWLDSKGWIYTKEEEMKRGEGIKTPDALLSKPAKILDKKVIWLDSKALFGDPEEIKRACNKQFKHYVRIFGPGAAVYWYGYVKIKNMPKDVLILDGSEFEKI